MLEEKYNVINQPMKHIFETTGKNSRTLIINYLYQLLGINNPQFNSEVDRVVGLIHNASLLIDDVQDKSLLRRGETCAHVIYGDALTINSGYLSIFGILKDNQIGSFIKGRDTDINKLLIDTLWNLHVGQGLDIYWTKTHTVPLIEEFNDMIDKKTGSLFVLILELGFLYNNSRSEEMNDLLRNIGRFFQIRDDYINIAHPEYWKEKGFCQDFDERKVSFIFTLLNSCSLDNTVFTFLQSHDELSCSDKLRMYTHLYDSKILTSTHKVLQEYKTKIEDIEKKITNSSNASPFLDKFFERLACHLPIEPSKIEHLAWGSDS